MQQIIKIGTRESQLAVWQATQVKNMLESNGYAAELVYIKSEGDIDLSTPLYEMGVQGVFTRSLDIAMLNKRIDIAVHSMKDVPTQLPKGIIQCAALKRGPYRDLIVYKNDPAFLEDYEGFANVATSSIRRIAQWLNRYPNHQVHNLRGNVNTRLRKLSEENWNGAIFAQAGLERIDLRPETSMELDWMLPAPAQGAIMVVCREGEEYVYNACQLLNDRDTEICTKIERDYLRVLMGGCSTPISALAEVKNGQIHFEGNILSVDGKQKAEVKEVFAIDEFEGLGARMAEKVLKNGGDAIVAELRAERPPAGQNTGS
jgi:hydroxymethylbilane synthase